MKVIEWLEKTYNVEASEYPVRPFAWCNDGYGISIQGGDRAKYCSPRELCNVYDSLELGFPTVEDEIINSFAEDKDTPTKTVYGYIPIETVEALILKHGGIDYEKSINTHIEKYKKAGISTEYEKLLK